MIKLINFKPRAFLFMTIGLIPMLFLIVWLLANLIGPEGANFNAMLFFGGFVGFHLLWINTIGLSLNLVNIKTGHSSNRKKSNILFIVLFSIYSLRMIITLPYFESIEPIFGVTLNILIGVSGIFLITYLFYKISDDYISLTKNRNPNLIDYFIMLFHFGFFLVGLMILHSHVRLILKDNDILRE
ncbi:hypothetical protein [Geofilum rhodophaeum]|uniref:hypothetical protein n=1 Tax=Geofilum rhodophaeum TaxID=1965019 RepID=UPI000B522D4E|nr:hypothetical protein [Geofilum rhodophaeum]